MSTPLGSRFDRLVFPLNRIGQQAYKFPALLDIQAYDFRVGPVQVIAQVEYLLAQLVRAPYCTEKKLVRSRVV